VNTWQIAAAVRQSRLGGRLLNSNKTLPLTVSRR
jgi:hypothetical protein